MGKHPVSVNLESKIYLLLLYISENK